jgi:hypothetical protein
MPRASHSKFDENSLFGGMSVILCLSNRKITLIHGWLYFELIILYNYPLLGPFEKFCQQEVHWFTASFPKLNRETCERGTRRVIFWLVIYI